MSPTSASLETRLLASTRYSLHNGIPFANHANRSGRMRQHLASFVAGFLLCAAPLSVMADERPEVLIIKAHPLGDKGLAMPATSLDGEALDRARDVNLGSTLSRQPGIHQTAFGTVVGRPVVHGLAGPRVRVMQDRLDTMDASIVSADHAVTVESFTAERVEVLRGPSILLYGSGAIGGAVNVQTGRIPQEPVDGLSGGMEARHNSATGGDTLAFKLKGGRGGFTWHLDGATKDGDDYDIPGYAESAYLRAQEDERDEDEDGHEEHEEHGEEEGHEEHEEHEEHGEEEGHEEHEEEARDKLPGSHFESDTIALGGAWHGDWGFAGLSVSRLESKYGLPGPHGHGHGHGEEEEHDEHGEHDEEEEGEGQALLDMEQTRIDFELNLPAPFAGIDHFNMRVGYSEYQHMEIESGDHASTKFSNDAWEVRAEFRHATGPWEGVTGLQYAYRDFEAVGEEAFVLPVITNSTGAFWVGRRAYEAFDLEAGVRLERVSHNPTAGGHGHHHEEHGEEEEHEEHGEEEGHEEHEEHDEHGESGDQDFTIHAVSIGALVPLGDRLELGLLASHSSRAPIAEELYAGGPHLVTNTYEIGDAGLSKERAASVALRLQYVAPSWDVAVATYFTRFSDYVYWQATGRQVNHAGRDRRDEALELLDEHDIEHEEDITEEAAIELLEANADTMEEAETLEASEEFSLREERVAQEDAEFFGIDAEASVQIASWPGGEARLHGKFDYVDAKLSVSGNDRLPRIPPLRYGIGLSGRWGAGTMGIEYLRAEDQDETAEHELPTDGYDDLSVHATLELPAGNGSTMEFFLHGKNLTDDEQRLHTSHIKDYAPQPGRTFEVGARLRF